MSEKKELHQKMLESILMKRRIRMHKKVKKQPSSKENSGEDLKSEMHDNSMESGNMGPNNPSFQYQPNVISPNHSMSRFYHHMSGNDRMREFSPSRSPNMGVNQRERFGNFQPLQPPTYSMDNPPVTNTPDVYFIPSQLPVNNIRSHSNSPRIFDDRNNIRNPDLIHAMKMSQERKPSSPSMFRQGRETMKTKGESSHHNRKSMNNNNNGNPMKKTESPNWISLKELKTLNDEEREVYVKSLIEQNQNSKPPTNTNDSVRVPYDFQTEPKTNPELFLEQLIDDEFDEPLVDDETNLNISQEILFNKMLDNASDNDGSEDRSSTSEEEEEESLSESESDDEEEEEEYSKNSRKNNRRRKRIRKRLRRKGIKNQKNLEEIPVATKRKIKRSQKKKNDPYLLVEKKKKKKKNRRKNNVSHQRRNYKNRKKSSKNNNNRKKSDEEFSLHSSSRKVSSSKKVHHKSKKKNTKRSRRRKKKKKNQITESSGSFSEETTTTTTTVTSDDDGEQEEKIISSSSSSSGEQEEEITKEDDKYDNDQKEDKEEEEKQPNSIDDIISSKLKNRKKKKKKKKETEIIQKKIPIPNPRVFCQTSCQTIEERKFEISTQTVKPPEKRYCEMIIQTDIVAVNEKRGRSGGGGGGRGMLNNLFGKSRKNKKKVKMSSVLTSTPIEWWEEAVENYRRKSHQNISVMVGPSLGEMISFPTQTEEEEDNNNNMIDVEIQCSISSSSSEDERKRKKKKRRSLSFSGDDDEGETNSQTEGYSDDGFDTPIPYTTEEEELSDSPTGGRRKGTGTKRGKRFSKIEVKSDDDDEEEDIIKSSAASQIKKFGDSIFDLPIDKEKKESTEELKKKTTPKEDVNEEEEEGEESTEEEKEKKEKKVEEEEELSEVQKYLRSKNDFPDFRPKSIGHLRLKKKVLLFHYSRNFDVVDERTRVLRKNFHLECFNSSEVKKFYALCTRNQYIKDSKILINKMTTDEEITSTLTNGGFFLRNTSRGKLVKRWFVYIPKYEILAWMNRKEHVKKINDKNKRNKGSSIRFQQVQCVRYFELPNMMMRKYGIKKDFENRPHYVISLQTLVKGGKKKIFVEMVHDQRKVCNQWFCSFVYMMLKASRGKIKL